jgi:hypothetical protein
MNATLLWKLLGSNSADFVAIEEQIGGLPEIFKLAPQAEALYSLYQAGGADKVLREGGDAVEQLMNAIPPAKLKAILPNIANILKTLQG